MKVPNRTGAPRVTELLSTQSFSFDRGGGGAPAAKQGTPPLPARHPDARKPAPSQEAAATPPISERDPAYVSVGLPSKFHFYPFKSISLRPLLGLHIAKFHRAHKEASLRLVVEAINSTLDPAVSAFDLTPADFYYLMYWQRVTSFSSTPMLIETYCTAPKHNDEVMIGVMDEEGQPVLDEDKKPVKKAKETLHIKDYLKATTLEVQDLPAFDMKEFQQLHDKYQLGYETMRDVVDMTEQVIDGGKDAEFAFKAGKAAFLAKGEGRMTLEERSKVFDKMDADEIAQLDLYIEKLSGYGVSEHAVMRCKDCGASTRVPVSFDALSFLSSGR